MELSVEDSSSFICKPSTVKLALTDDGWVGKATLFGDWQSLEFDGKKLPVEASDKKKNVINGEARIIRSIGRVTSIELHFGRSKPAFGQSFSATLRCGEKESVILRNYYLSEENDEIGKWFFFCDGYCYCHLLQLGLDA